MAWVIGADTDLPLNETLRWDGPAAARRVFELAMFDSDAPDYELARRAFLVYDDERPELRGSYKLGIADVVDGELFVLASGLRAAASRLPQTADLSEDIVNEARAIIDYYVAEMQDDEEQLSKIMAPILETKFDAPAWLRANARRGLEWHREGLSGDGVVERTLREARAMADGFVSEDKAVRMAAWFARHMVDLDAPAANPDHEDYPSPGVVAHALWGGGTRRQSERAQRWAEQQVASMQESDERTKTWLSTSRHERKAGFLTPSSINGRTVTGIFSVFGNMDSYADVIHSGAFSKTLSERAGRVLHLWQHDMDAPPIALIDSLREVPRQALPGDADARADGHGRRGGDADVPRHATRQRGADSDPVRRAARDELRVRRRAVRLRGERRQPAGRGAQPARAQALRDQRRELGREQRDHRSQGAQHHDADGHAAARAAGGYEGRRAPLHT